MLPGGTTSQSAEEATNLHSTPPPVLTPKRRLHPTPLLLPPLRPRPRALRTAPPRPLHPSSSSSSRGPVRRRRRAARRVRRARRRVVRRRGGHDRELHRRVALAERALGGADRRVVVADRVRARGHVRAGEHALQQRERQHRLVEGHLVPAVVDARERVRAALLDLPVHDAVRRQDVGVARRREAGRVDFRGDGLPAEPVAVVCVYV